MNKHSSIVPAGLLLAAAFLLNTLSVGAQQVTFPPYDYFTASPSPVGMTDPPSETNLHWLYKDVTSCTGSGFSAANSQPVTFYDPSIVGYASGMEGWTSVPVSATTTFTLTCTGPARTVVVSQTVAPSPMYFGMTNSSDGFTRYYSTSAALATWSVQGTVPYGTTPNLPTQKTCETLARETGLAANATYWCVEAHDYNAPTTGLCVYTCQGGGDVSAGSSPGSYSYKTTLYSTAPATYSSMLTNPDGSLTFPNPNPPPSGTDGCVGGPNYDYYSPGTWSCSVFSHVAPVSAAQPNLTAGAVSPTTATAGTAVTLAATVSNTGATSTGTTFTNLFQRATDSAGTNATDIGTDASPIVAAAGTDTTQLSYAFPSAGTWYVRACADKNAAAGTGTVTESDETDNCGAWTAVAVAPSFTLSCSVNPSSITAGQSTTWSASPSNLGTYTWTPSEGGSAGGDEATLDRTYSTAGNYSMSVAAGGQSVACTNYVAVGSACSGATVTLTAAPDRVAQGGTTVLTVSGSGISGSCTVSGPGVNQTVNASSCTVPSTNITTGAITTQATYTVTCGAATDTAIVNVIPIFEEF